MRFFNRRTLLLMSTGVLLFAGTEPDAYSQSESVIYSFPGGNTGGSVPENGLTFHNGSVFGVTAEGGGLNSDGILFQLAPDGEGGWNEEPVHIFEGGAGGATPSPVLFDAAGNVYGEAASFGAYGYGLIFELSATGGGWKMDVLYNFKGGSDGGYPSGGLALDAAGNLYGTTAAGGDVNLCQLEPWDSGCGVLFKLSRGPNGAWTESVLYTFRGEQDGYSPAGGLTIDAQDGLYGITMFYGFSGDGGIGLVFRLSPQVGGEWKYSVLHHFADGEGGQFPLGNLVLAGDSIYGTTLEGGVMSACNGLGCGVAYELSRTTNKFSILHAFTGAVDGGSLFSPLTLANGSLFGTTQIGGDLSLCQGTGGSRGDGCGVVYKLSLSTTSADGASGFRVVHTFADSNNNDGDGPDGQMTADSAGNLYGETRIGGTYGLGAIFEIAP